MGETMEASETTSPAAKGRSWPRHFRSWLVPATIMMMAFALILLISGNWKTWAGERVEQTTDDAYLRADLTPLSAKAAGLVASVEVADYQEVKAGDLIGASARRRFLNSSKRPGVHQD